eukprot:215270-Chlamydomonas_euryale.AAC.5
MEDTPCGTCCCQGDHDMRLPAARHTCTFGGVANGGGGPFVRCGWSLGWRRRVANCRCERGAGVERLMHISPRDWPEA